MRGKKVHLLVREKGWQQVGGRGPTEAHTKKEPIDHKKERKIEKRG